MSTCPPWIVWINMVLHPAPRLGTDGPMQGWIRRTSGYTSAPLMSFGSRVSKLVLFQGLGCFTPGFQFGCGRSVHVTPCHWHAPFSARFQWA